MKNDFMMAINQVCHERQLAIDIVLEAVEVALVSAYKRNFGGNQSLTAQIDSVSGEPLIFVEKLVVEEVENEKKEISLKDAKAINSKAEFGNLISIESTPSNFGRIAAQTAKQVILQRIREAERDVLYNTYAEREGEIVSGTVHKIDPHQVTLTLGKAEAVLPRNEQIPTEHYREGQRLRAYVASVIKTNRGPQIIVSRTHRTMLRRLLEVEVPEIYNGTVEIKSIAREAGYRSKVAVAALQEGVDPVGSCVGMRGTRIQNIVNELNGEKIDVVQWNPDLTYFIANSLSPAKVMNVMLNDTSGKTAGVVVPDKQLSLAIGKEGQNARLAAKLTGWRIDIKSVSEATAETLRKVKEVEVIHERMTKKMELFNMAAAVLDKKAPIEFNDGELNLLSEAIEAVTLAEMAIARERKAEAEAARKAAKEVDILAEAEAILAASPVPEGAAPIEEELLTDAIDEVEAVPEAEAPPQVEDAVETVAEAEVDTPDVEDIMAEAEAILAEETTEPEVVEEPEVTAEPEIEAEPEPEAKKEPVEFEVTSFEEWKAEHESEDDAKEREMEKKKARQKKRRLVYDERLGEVVAERRRKRSRRTDDWYDLDDDDDDE